MRPLLGACRVKPLRIGIFVGGMAMGAALSFLLCSLQLTHSSAVIGMTHISAPTGPPALVEGKKLIPPKIYTGQNGAFQRHYDRLVRGMRESLYRFDRPGLLLPLMRLSEAERSRSHRAGAGRAWLRSQSAVVAATVRTSMAGLPSTMHNVQRLRALFNESWLVLVENNSNDSTRSFLYNMTLTDPNVRLLGCGRVNSPLPCEINVRYGSGRQHLPGVQINRTFSEEVERGLIMSALRNMYLDYIYEHLADRASLLLIVDPDITWQDWDLDSITQGLYYFAAKPKLQQLCAHTTQDSHLYDPCTLSFHLNKRFGEDTKYPVVSYERSLRDAPRSLPPVKVESCFQAVSFYRMSALAALRLRYRRSPGEWICEHNTLSRQLDEVYIDPQMRLRVTSGNIG